jgi:hypothetical protein
MGTYEVRHTCAEDSDDVDWRLGSLSKRRELRRVTGEQWLRRGGKGAWGKESIGGRGDFG